MNITTLNTIGLDGVIIKKGGGTTTPPSGGGEVLEGEYYLARPNGWYWKYVGDKTITPDSELYGLWRGLSLMLISCDSMYSAIMGRYYVLPFVWMVPELVMLSTNEGKDIKFETFSGFAEKAITYSEVGLVGESLYEAILTMSGATLSEAEFEAMMLSEYGLQRITKEEYESLITA